MVQWYKLSAAGSGDDFVYWSSSELDINDAWNFTFYQAPIPSWLAKNAQLSVRAIRSF